MKCINLLHWCRGITNQSNAFNIFTKEIIRIQRFKLIYLPTKVIVLSSYNAHFMNMEVVIATSHSCIKYYFSTFSLFINLSQYHIHLSSKNYTKLTIYLILYGKIPPIQESTYSYHIYSFKIYLGRPIK